MIACHLFTGVSLLLVLLTGALVECSAPNVTSPVVPRNDRPRVLSRKRRFLLFPPGANFIVTISGGKGSMFLTPRGYNLVAEMDMYHPLPDYLYHATSLRLGTVAPYPDETTTTAPSTTPEPLAPTDHHNAILSNQEVEQYLRDHPDTWIPPGWNAQRRTGWSDRPASPPVRTYQSWKSKLWESTGTDRLYYDNPSIRRLRSNPVRLTKDNRDNDTDNDDDEDELSFWATASGNEVKLNISHQRGWEHFHHYRDRRSLYDHLESVVPSFFGFHMKECLLRSICEARNLLPPKGRSMTVDLLRVIFTYPLREELSDEYSRMMRAERPNCHQLFAERCPLSLLQLVLFGKFER
uniref:Uncharacterized protein n=1 Tax=Anopheles albimanus TaxID=7167 RepID=A0A182FNM8_ANOAL